MPHTRTDFEELQLLRRDGLRVRLQPAVRPIKILAHACQARVFAHLGGARDDAAGFGQLDHLVCGGGERGERGGGVRRTSLPIWGKHALTPQDSSNVNSYPQLAAH